MATHIQRFCRPISEVWELCKPKARMGAHPFEFTTYEDNERVLTSLTSLDREAWARAYSEAARPFEEQALEAEARDDRESARDNYLHAFGLYRMARYPTTNSPGKRAAYRKSQEMFLKAARFFDVPPERVEIPFHGRPGEGDRIVCYLSRPRVTAPMPVILIWGGIDGYKEDRTRQTDLALMAGMATLTLDMPGVGDAPLKGSEDAERLWDPIFDWIAAAPELDERRVAVWGGSTGGYWSAKLAHLHRDRIAAAVVHGACLHYTFLPDWIEKAQHGEYPFELAETLAYAFGLSSFEEWVDYAPKLSLLTQGVLDRPSAPTLVVNGLHDSTFPISDSYLLLEHGDPKYARFFDAPHMGLTPRTMPMVVNWVARTLGLEAR